MPATIPADLASDLDQSVAVVTRLNRRISILAERRNRITRAMRLLSLQADAQAARLRDLIETADAQGECTPSASANHRRATAE